MERTAGTVTTTGSIAYVAQSAWIINATVRGNITFGKPFDQARYDAVVEATSLEHDFKVQRQPTINCTERQLFCIVIKCSRTKNCVRCPKLLLR